MERRTSRREFLRAAGGAVAGVGLASVITVQPARATPAAMQEAINKVVGAARVTTGRVKLELPPLSENGHAVPITVSVGRAIPASGLRERARKDRRLMMDGIGRAVADLLPAEYRGVYRKPPTTHH